MDVRIVNGCTVSRIGKEGGDGELLGAFQYELDADEFVALKMKEDVTRGWAADYVVASSYSGRVKVLRATKKEPAHG